MTLAPDTSAYTVATIRNAGYELKSLPYLHVQIELLVRILHKSPHDGALGIRMLPQLPWHFVETRASHCVVLS